jgi:hypothetical protein
MQTVFEIAERSENSRFGTRLWERRTGDSDFGAVRLGMGTRPSSVIYKLGQGGNTGDESPLAKDAKKLEADSLIVSEVPITVPLRPFVKEATGSPPRKADPSPRRWRPATRSASSARTPPTRPTWPGPCWPISWPSLGGGHPAAHHRPSPRPGRLAVGGMAAPLQRARIDEEDQGDTQQRTSCASKEKEQVAEFWKRLKRS